MNSGQTVRGRHGAPDKTLLELYKMWAQGLLRVGDLMLHYGLHEKRLHEWGKAWNEARE